MKQNTSSESAGSAVAAVLQALAMLEVEIVDRCPSADCPLCGPALPIAA